MKLRHWILVAALLASAAHAQEPSGGRPDPAKAEGAATQDSPVKKRRLKFKSDKACTCASALGEADIEAAVKRAQDEPQPRRSEK